MYNIHIYSEKKTIVVTASSHCVMPCHYVIVRCSIIRRTIFHRWAQFDIFVFIITKITLKTNKYTDKRISEFFPFFTGILLHEVKKRKFYWLKDN